MEKDAELYEIGYLLKSDLGDEDVLSFSEKLRNTITDKSGLITSDGKPRRQNLAYPIKGETFATFNWLNFMAKPSLISTVEKYMEDQSVVLRFLIIKTEKEKTPKPGSLKARRIRTKREEGVAPVVPGIDFPAGRPDEKKEEIKEEEIDKKIEELLGD